MVVLSQSLGVAVQVAFVLLALATLAGWIRHRDQQRTFLVLAMITLSILVVLGPIDSAIHLPARVTADLAIVDFLLSGYFLLLFRDSLVPLGRGPKWIISGFIAAVAVLAIAADLPTAGGDAHSSFQVFAEVVVVATWIVCVAEPIFRLGIASLGRPAVEGARLRALSLGYAGLIGVLLVGTLSGSAGRSTNMTVATDIVVLVVVPMLYASFSPPAWLRRIWAYPEQDEIRRALHDLLLYSPDRESLARKAIEWGARLVGGAAAFIVDADGSILAVRGITKGAAIRMAAAPPQASSLSLPLDLQEGRGTMTIISGPFTPVFGQYEVGLLRGYSVSITAGLNRVSLTQRIAQLEQAKTDFLNLASHELRAPMTVIKGYLTMLAGGTLGEMPEKANSVLPMLVAKSDEITSMLEQMIEASRLEEGRLALKKQRMDIVELTEATIAEMQPLLADRTDLHFDKPAGEVWSSVDPDRYQIVVRNLITNAVKYSPAGSSVRVRLLPNDHTACLEVIDEGIGIAAEDQARLFTRFGRIENRATMHTSGTGLGLWLSREIARMHDGDLTVHSEVGRGSSFTLEIPIDSKS